MLENAVYSVISPEGCASILWKDAKMAPEASAALKLTAQDLYDFKIADKIIRENGLSNEQISDNLKETLVGYLKELMPLSDTERAEERYKKFREIGIA